MDDWRWRISQALRVAELVAAGRRVYLGENPAGWLQIIDPPGRLIYDGRGRPVCRLVGEAEWQNTHSKQKYLG